MSSQEISLSLTPQEAATGVTITVPLSTGSTRLRIPPARDGDLVRARVGGEEVLLRIRVSGGAAGPTPPPTSPMPAASPAPGAPGTPSKSSPLGCLVAVGILAAVVIAFVAMDNDDSEDTTGSASKSTTPTPTATAYTYAPPTYAPPTYVPPTYSKPTQPARTPDTSAPAAAPTFVEPSPYDRGTCLNGQLPDSETAQRVSNIDEVPCSASDAHYKVIETFPGTIDMEKCKDNPRTEYSFSAKYTYGSTVTRQYVYCLVGLGSYAR
ncbi:hypothetical protein OOK31_35135 [Streptomyces sp. NBC_00249]|uniref:LppU/SCO3897 family protein n=1 Tax=Streptomyces sp. NBC_00249 TaxID=2975690 RepID=UPI0022583091|nr:hypothetical protein [Streptomyces sp. NBC_00249]MCX5199063.1 hypothetical protein [Streptomyces sp. NBC_00249]